MTEDEFHKALRDLANAAINVALLCEYEERRAWSVREEDARAQVLAEFRHLTAENARLRAALETLADYGNWEHAIRVPVREHEDHRQLGRTIALIWIGDGAPFDIAANAL